MRTALGGTRSRVMATLLIEAAMLCAAGGALGLLLSPVMLDLLAIVAPAQVLIPNSAASIPVLRATLDVSLLATAFVLAVLFGLPLAIPSLWTAMRETPALTASSAGSRVSPAFRLRWLVGAELALAVLLAAGAGLTLRSAAHLASRDPGVDPAGVLTTYFGNVEARPVPERAEYFRLVLAAVEAIPGVRRAAIKDYRPFEGEDDFMGIRFPERPPVPRGAGVREEWRRVSEGYFETTGMRLISGRIFTPGDFRGPPRSAVINQAFAAKHYAGQDPVGRRLALAEKGYDDVEIAGVIADVRSRGWPSRRRPWCMCPTRPRRVGMSRCSSESTAHPRCTRTQSATRSGR